MAAKGSPGRMSCGPWRASPVSIELKGVSTMSSSRLRVKGPRMCTARRCWQLYTRDGGFTQPAARNN